MGIVPMVGCEHKQIPYGSWVTDTFFTGQPVTMPYNDSFCEFHKMRQRGQYSARFLFASKSPGKVWVIVWDMLAISGMLDEVKPGYGFVLLVDDFLVRGALHPEIIPQLPKWAERIKDGGNGRGLSGNSRSIPDAT